jgi:hypothetical protein
MIELIVFGGLLLVGLAVAAVLGFVFFVMKLVLWIVLLPFRLLLKALMIPVWLTIGSLGLAAGALSLPILAAVFGGLILMGIVGAILALMLPAIPFVLLALLLWVIFRRSPAVA